MFQKGDRRNSKTVWKWSSRIKKSLAQWLPDFVMHDHHLWEFVKTQIAGHQSFWFSRLLWGLRICISNQVPRWWWCYFSWFENHWFGNIILDTFHRHHQRADLGWGWGEGLEWTELDIAEIRSFPLIIEGNSKSEKYLLKGMICFKKRKW